MVGLEHGNPQLASKFFYLGSPIAPITVFPPDYATDAVPVVNPVPSVHTAQIPPVYLFPVQHESVGNYVRVPPYVRESNTSYGSDSTDPLLAGLD